MSGSASGGSDYDAVGSFQPRRRGGGFLLVVHGHEADGQRGAVEALRAGDLDRRRSGRASGLSSGPRGA